MSNVKPQQARPPAHRSGRPPRNADRRRRALVIALTALIALGLLSLSLVSAYPQEVKPQLGAVVNEDIPAEVDGELAPMGRQLTAELVLLEGPYKWEITTAEKAEEGLANGTFATAVFIPPDFSEKVTSLTTLSDAVQATILVQMHPGASHSETVEAELEVWKATASLGDMLSEEFVTGIFSGFDEMRNQLSAAAEGTRQLRDGTLEAEEGSKALANGAEDLSIGAGQAREGIEQIAGGAGSLAGGLQQLAEGSTEATAGAQELAGGAGQLSAAGSDLSKGAQTLARGADELATGAADSARGAKQLETGTQEYVAGVDELADGMEDIISQLDPLVPVVADLETNLQNAESQLDDFTGNAQTWIQDELPQALDKACAADGTQPWCTDPELRAELQAALDQLAGELQASVDDGDLSQAMAWLRDQLGVAHEQLQSLGEDLDRLEEAKAGLPELRKGGQFLLEGTGELAKGLQQLSTGSHSYADGAQEYARGVKEYTGGVRGLASGSQELAGGIGQLADGAYSASRGAGELADGAGQAAWGVGQLADGSGQLAEGAGELGSGLGEIASGVGELSDGLSEAGEQLPDVTTTQAADLGSTLASPIERPELGFGVPTAPAVALALLLWLVSLLLQSAYPAAVPYLSSSTRPAIRLTVRALLAPALLTALLGAVGASILAFLGGVSVGTTGALIGFGALVGLTFSAIQQALALSLPRGWVTVSVSVLVVAISAALTSSADSGLSVVADILPTGVAARIFAALFVPGLPKAELAGVLLILWGAAGIAVATAATANRRRAPEAALAVTS